MTWTPRTPTVSGWYWYRTESDPRHDVIVYVDATLAVEPVAVHVSELRGHWIGPLEPAQ